MISRQCVSGELPVHGAPGGVQPAVAAAPGGRGLPAAVGARVRPRPYAALAAAGTLSPH